ncbi:hypothetical protein [Sodalis praecaptivus]|uniref:hypothetical protein n=1 Tax=Sodalis praecaptivus TaxID=1239307 RepID=UPI0011DCAE7F|nr:hypothetical protein [Sodalis praecaptivus]
METATVSPPSVSSTELSQCSQSDAPSCEDDFESALSTLFSQAEDFVDKINVLKTYFTDVEAAIALMHEYNTGVSNPAEKRYVRKVKEGVNRADYQYKCAEMKGIIKVVKEMSSYCPALKTKLGHLFFIESSFSSKNEALISEEYCLAAAADIATLLPVVPTLLSLAEKLGKGLGHLEAKFLGLKAETEKTFLTTFCYAPDHPETHYVQLAEGKSQNDWVNYVKNLSNIDAYGRIPARLAKFSDLLDLDNKFIIKEKNPLYSDLRSMKLGKPLPDFTYLKEGWSDLG